MKYTELLRLPDYDPIKCHLIDPMHNLLLGSAEKVCECGIEKNILQEKGLKEINPLIQKVPVPSNVGRVAGSILISFNPIQDGLFGGYSRIGGGGCFLAPLLKICRTYPTIMKLGTGRSKKCITHVTHLFSSAYISIFSSEISKFCYIKK